MNDEVSSYLKDADSTSVSEVSSPPLSSDSKPATPRERTKRTASATLRTASVVINTYNRAAHLGNAIRSIAYQSYPAIELIVVNGPSTDATEEILESLVRSGIPIKVAACASRNLSQSRNIGIAQAVGDVVLFIDDDAVAHPDWVAQLMAAYDDPRVGAAGGFTIDHTGISFQCRYTVCDRFGNASFLNLIDATEIMEGLQGFHFPSLLGTNCSFRRSDLLGINGFDEAYAYFLDETDVCLRLFNEKRKIVTVPRALVFHKYAPSDLRTVEKIPNSLLASATSKAHFVTKHGTHGSRGGNPVLAGQAELERYTRELQFSNRWYLDHKKISTEHYLRLDDELQKGIAEGIRSGLEVLRASHSSAPRAMDRGSPFANCVGEGRATAVRERLRIYFVSQGYPPADTAGIARWTHECARSLSARGHEVHVLTRTTTSANFVDYVEGVWVHYLVDEFPESMPRCPVDIPDSIARRAAAVYAEIVRSESIWGVDVVSAPIWDLEGLFCVNHLHKPVVTSLHTTYLLALPSKPEWSECSNYRRKHIDKVIHGERWLLANSKYILANSREVVREINRAYGLDVEGYGNRVHLIPHGIAEPAQAGRKDSEKHRDARRNPEGAVSILFVGRIEPRKGVDQLLRALLRLRPMASKLLVNLVGSWPPDTDSYAGKVKALAKEIAAKRKDISVNFTGYASEEDLLQHYASADIFVAPSRFESFGLIVIEAMRGGCPVIASNIGGMREIIDEDTGLLVDVDDPDSLALRLTKLISDRSLRAKLGSAGRKKYEAEYTASKMATELESYYRLMRKELDANDSR